MAEEWRPVPSRPDLIINADGKLARIIKHRDIAKFLARTYIGPCPPNHELKVDGDTPTAQTVSYQRCEFGQKLTAELARQVKADFAGKMSVRAAAKKWHLSEPVLRRIRDGFLWADV